MAHLNRQLHAGANWQRILQSLIWLTTDVFPSRVQNQMVETFHGLVRPCFEVDSLSNEWKSELCLDGTPVEFAFKVSRTKPTLRFVVDTHKRPGTWEDAAESIRRYTSVLLPTEDDQQLLQRIAQEHFKGAGNAVRSYVALSARFDRASGLVPRLYVNTSWKERDELIKLWRPFVSEDILRWLDRPPVAAYPVFGVGYDFVAARVCGLKVYFLMHDHVRERVLELAHETLGEKATSLARMVDLAASLKGPGWRIPPMLASVGFWNDGTEREVKMAIPLVVWEWDTYDSLVPVLSALAREWSPLAPENNPSPVSSDEPLWRFALTHLSLAVSTSDENMTVYFSPAKAGPDDSTRLLDRNECPQCFGSGLHPKLDRFLSTCCL
ncbi:MAG: tryptophan dimethylallyltransferase family protein [Thermodesulfobacteriota bacterium]